MISGAFDHGHDTTVPVNIAYSVLNLTSMYSVCLATRDLTMDTHISKVAAASVYSSNWVNSVLPMH